MWCEFLGLDEIMEWVFVYEEVGEKKGVGV